MHIYDRYNEPVHSGGQAICSMAQYSAVGNKIIIDFGKELTRCPPKQVQSIVQSLKVFFSVAKCLSVGFVAECHCNAGLEFSKITGAVIPTVSLQHT